MIISFRGGSAAWRRAIAARYAAFESAEEPAFRIVHGPAAVAGEETAGPWPAVLTAGTAPGLLEMRGAGFTAAVDLAGGTADISGPDAAYPVDMLLPELLPLLADGVVMHCALLSDGERAWVCAGPSGCGKSTLAALLPDRALCDELALVSDGGGRFTARSLPFWDARPGGAPLAAVVLLRHGSGAHRLRPLPPERALAVLAREIRWPNGEEAALARAFSTLSDLVEVVPTFELEFVPRTDVWDAITEAA